MQSSILKTTVLLFGLSFLFYGYVNDDTNVKKIKYHPDGFSQELPEGFNDLFAGSGECALCHDEISTASGENVSITNAWRSTMMANAAKDPFWRAKVSHETLVDPEHKEALENTCIRCHAPAGHENAHHNGQASYSIAEMEADPIALDGVNCTVCHQITAESMGNYSSNFLIGKDKIIWGPFSNDLLQMPMINHTDYTPEYGAQIKDSRLCGSCHTLITNTVDLEGKPTGTTFVEQAIFHEWQNSAYATIGVSCQSCHIPEIKEGVIISSMPPWLDVQRLPFGKHELVGANIFMLNILKNNIESLGVTATTAQFDQTIARTYQMLQEKSIETTLTQVDRTQDSLFMELVIKNKAGHKFPGGYPSRKVFIELMVVNENNDTTFHSGQMDENGQLIQEDDDYERHYNTIYSEDQVQIYEMVMGNVKGEVTTILERAYTHLKDNRLPPNGFTTNHFSYDTVQIVGKALLDNDFNKLNGKEGSGADKIQYHIPIKGESGNLAIIAKVYYQTVSSKWLEHMFSYSSKEIDAFKSYYEAADKMPTLVQEVSVISEEK